MRFCNVHKDVILENGHCRKCVEEGRESDLPYADKEIHAKAVTSKEGVEHYTSMRHS
jgi:hypothetical protein